MLKSIGFMKVIDFILAFVDYIKVNVVTPTSDYFNYLII